MTWSHMGMVDMAVSQAHIGADAAGECVSIVFNYRYGGCTACFWIATPAGSAKPAGFRNQSPGAFGAAHYLKKKAGNGAKMG